MDCIQNYCHQGSAQVLKNLGSDCFSTNYHHFPLSYYFWWSCWRENRFDGRDKLYGVYHSRNYLDDSNYKFLCKYRFVFYLAKFNHSIEELLVSPVPNWVILLGYVSGGVLRGFSVGLGVFLAIYFFIDISVSNLFIAFIIFLLTSTLFSLAGFINAVFANSFDDITIVPTFILMPLTYLGGMFYSIEILPEFWQSISKVNPIFYMIDGFRIGFYGVGSASLIESLMVLLGMITALAMTAYYLLNKGVNIKS